MTNLKFKVHWSFFVLGVLMIIYGKFSTFLCSIFCVLLHEMGHSLVGRKLGDFKPAPAGKQAPGVHDLNHLRPELQSADEVDELQEQAG